MILPKILFPGYVVIKNVRPTHPGVSEQKAWEEFKAVTNHKGLYNGLNIAHGVYNFEGNMVNSSGIYRFPAKALQYIR